MSPIESRPRFWAVHALALAACVSLLAGCDWFDDDEGNVDNTNFSATEDFDFRVAVANRTRIRLEAINGNVEITGKPNVNSLVIAGEKKVRSESLQDATVHLDDLDVRVTETVDEVRVSTDQPDNPRGRNYQVDYTISVPEHMNVTIVHVNGRVGLYDLESDADVKLVNGEIDGKMVLPSGGSIDLDLVNGNINLSIPTSTSTSAIVDCDIVNGDIHTTNLDMHNVTNSAHSVRGTLGDGDGSITMSTVNGVLRLTGYN
jgi:DUF4097 and DUF4098 domain-containing protein YvlB